MILEAETADLLIYGQASGRWVSIETLDGLRNQQVINLSGRVCHDLFLESMVDDFVIYGCWPWELATLAQMESRSASWMFWDDMPRELPPLRCGERQGAAMLGCQQCFEHVGINCWGITNHQYWGKSTRNRSVCWFHHCMNKSPENYRPNIDHLM